MTPITFFYSFRRCHAELLHLVEQRLSADFKRLGGKRPAVVVLLEVFQYQVLFQFFAESPDIVIEPRFKSLFPGNVGKPPDTHR